MSTNNKNQIPKALLLALALFTIVPVSESLADSESQTVDEVKEVSTNDVENAQKEVDRLKEEVKIAEENLNTAQSELAEAKAKQEEQDSNLNAAQINYDNAKKAKDEADSKLYEAYEKQNEASDEVIDIQERIQAQREAEAALAEANNDLESAKSEQAAKQDEVKNAEAKYTEAVQEYSESFELLEEANANYEEVKADYDNGVMDELEKNVSDGEAEIDKLKNEIDNVDNSAYTNPEKQEELKEKKEIYEADEANYLEKSQEHTDAIIALNERKAEISEKQKEKDDINNEIEEATHKWHDISTKLKKGDLSVTEEDEEAAYKELKDLKNKYKDRLASIDKEIEELEENLISDQANVDNLSSDLGEAFNKLTDSSQELYESEESIKVEKEIASGELSLENISQKIAEAEEAAQKAEEESEQALDALDKAKENYEKTLENVEFDRANYKESIRTYKDYIEKNKISGYWSDEEIEGYRKSIKYCEEELAKLDPKVEEARKVLNDAEVRSNQALEEALVANARSTSLYEAQKTLGELEKANEQKREELRENLAKLEDKLEEDKKALDNAKAELAEAQNNIDEVNQLIADSKEELEIAQKALEDAYKERKTAKENLTKAEEKVAELEKKLGVNKATDEELAKAKEELAKAKEELAKAKEEATEAKDKLNEASESLSKYKEEKKKADEDLEAAEKKVDEAQKTLKEKENELLSAEDKVNVSKAKESLRKLVETAKNIDDEQLDKIVKEVEEALEEPNLTVSEIIDLENKLTNAISKVKDKDKPADPDKTDEKEESKVEEDYKNMFLENLLTLSKLTDSEKESFKARMDKAKTNGEIYNIYNEAIDLNNSRDKNPEESNVEEDYKNMFLENLLTLSKLTDSEKESFKARMDKAKTNGEIYDIYNEAIELNNSRSKKIVEDNKDEEKLDPNKTIDNENKEKGKIAPSIPINDILKNRKPSVSVSSNIVYVPREYKNIKHGFYKKSILLEKHNILKRAFIENKIRSEACKWILKHAPNIAKANRNELQRLIYQAESLQKKAKAILVEYDKILKIDDKCKDL